MKKLIELKRAKSLRPVVISALRIVYRFVSDALS